jgi:uncharacterized repeat protein (TIGR02059 family)
MKIVFFTLFITLSTYLAATDYYVKNGGNDLAQGNSEASAWASIEKVNSKISTLNPGDRILFNRGDKFYGKIIISKSGISGSPVTFGAYGTGDKPIITGFTEINSWTNEGNGIYSASLTSEAPTNMVVIDGKQYAMGRWPDDGYNIFETASSNISITDNDIGSDINWAGAEVVIRKNDWSYDRCKIDAQSGGVLTYKSLGSVQVAEPNHGYFIQNDIRTLTTYGEWFHDFKTQKIYIYFGNNDPESKVVEIATLKNLVYNEGHDYITIDNLNFKGSIGNMVEFIINSCNYLTIQNTLLRFAGLDAINLWGKNGRLSNNSISLCNQTGIKALGNEHTIVNNVIENVGLVVGQAVWGNLTNGIGIANDNCLVKNNTIRNIGYCGIKLSSTADIITIQNNYINNVLLTLNDGGGIYTAAEGVARKIDGNIITNVIGNTAGTPYPGRHIARGIYLDVNSTNVIVTNNTVANCNEAGYMIHRAHDNRIENNTAFNNNYGMFFQNSSGSSIRNNSLRNNLFIAKSATQFSLKFYSVADDISSFGTADYNYYARPANDSDVFQTYSPSTGSKSRTLAGWQSLTNQDKNSKKSAVTVSDTSKIDFHYNPSTSNKVITLSQPMVDVTGKKYSGSVTLLPYTSVILMPDPNPYTPAVPVFSTASIENGAPTVLLMNYSINLASAAPATTAFSVTVNGTARTVSSVSVSGNKVSLTLSSRINYGDVVKVSYTKPSASPLQTSEGAQAASISGQAVTNNCTAPTPTPDPTPDPTQPPAPANQPPVISIASPTKGSSYCSPAAVDIEITANDPDGTIQSVALFNGTVKLGEKTSAPFIFTLKDLEVGTYSLHAVATDNLKSSSTSGALEFHITAPEPVRGSFKLYPNPNNGQFSIDYAAPEGLETYTVSVVNSNGRTVLVEEVPQDQYVKPYDLSYLVPGIYIVVISASDILLTQKFIKR